MNRINLICLGVRDMERSLAFYKKIGFQTYEKESNPPVVFFDNRGTKLELYPLDGLAKDIGESVALPAEGVFPGVTLACNMKSEREVDDFLALAEQSGGSIAKKAQKVFWGGYSGYFRDPDGYYWEVAYADIWKFDADDMLVLGPPES